MLSVLTLNSSAIARWVSHTVWPSAQLDAAGDGVFVQGLLEQVCGGLEGLLVAFDALVAGIGLEDRRAGEAE